VILTGAAGELGYRAGEQLHRSGYGVLLLDIEAVQHEYLRRRLDSADPRLTEYLVDLSSEDSLKSTLDKITVDPYALINMAGMKVFGQFDALDAGLFNKVIAVNLLAPVQLCRWALPRMPPGGVILNVASAAAFSAPQDYTAYSASKFGLLGFSLALADELRGSGIRLNTLCPHTVATSEFIKREGITDSRRLVPVERLNNTILKLLSPNSNTHGHNIRFFRLRNLAGSIFRDVKRWIKDVSDMIEF